MYPRVPFWGLCYLVFINDIFYFIENSKIANYADDNTVYSTNDTLEGFLQTLECDTSILLKWFQDNEMKSNEDKCHLFLVNTEDATVKLGDEILSACSSIDLLGITIDNSLNFSEYVSNLCKKGSQKLHALARVSKYLSRDKLKLLMKSFITSQFNYCPLSWMFHNRTLNNKINKFHERALRLVYRNDDCTFQDLLVMDNSATIHERNLQRLATEMFKVRNKISPVPIQGLFEDHINYHNLRSNRCWEISKVRTVNYGTETMRYRGPKIWGMLPPKIKESKSLEEVKLNIKKWKPLDCTCRLCREFVHNLGFIN